MRRLPRPLAAVPVGLLLLAAACGSVTSPDGPPPTQPRTFNAQAVAADGGLECPATVTDREGLTVPAMPQGVDGRSRLLPDRQPSSLVDCAYPVVDNGAATPTGPPFAMAKRTLATTSQVDDVVALLAWAPLDTGRGTVCTMIAGPEAVHLIGARYDDAIVWVAALAEPNRCKPATNGDFRTPLPVGYQLDQWFGARPTDSPPQPACDRRVGGRLGDDVALVPDGDPIVTVCRPTGSGMREHRLSTDQSRQVVSALRSLPTEPAHQMCAASTTPDGAKEFRLVLDYGRGPDVIIDVTPDCQPELLSSARSADDAGAVIDLVEQWSRPVAGYDPDGSVSSTGTD